MSNNDDIKQIQFSPDLLKIKKKRQTKKKPPATKLSAGTVNTIKNNLVQRIQSHKINEMGGIEKLHSTQHKIGQQVNQQIIPKLPTTNHLNDAMSYLSNIKGTNHLTKTIKQSTLTNQKQLNSASSINNSHQLDSASQEPAYGILKGGTKPLYRSWVNQTLKHPQTHTTNNDKPSVLKVVRKRRMTLGKTKHNVGVLVKNAKTRKDIMQAKNEIQNAKIHDIKHDLFKKGMIRTGSQAPDDILKKMYESSILAGYLTNNNNIYQNALDDIKNNL